MHSDFKRSSAIANADRNFIVLGGLAEAIIAVGMAAAGIHRLRRRRFVA